jgi:hypothetical protein
MMGHQQEIGFVTTQAFGQAVLFRVDQPELLERKIVLKRPELHGDRWGIQDVARGHDSQARG